MLKNTLKIEDCLLPALFELYSFPTVKDRIISLLIEAETLRPKNPGRTSIMEEKDQHSIEIDKIEHSHKECASILTSYDILTQRLNTIQNVKAAISGLPQPEQRLFIERYLEEKPVKEIVSTMNISPATYWRFHKRGMNSLCSSLEKSNAKEGTSFALTTFSKTRL